MSELILRKIELQSNDIKYTVEKKKALYKIVGVHPDGFRSYSYATNRHRVCRFKEEIKNLYIMDRYQKKLKGRGSDE